MIDWYSICKFLPWNGYQSSQCDQYVVQVFKRQHYNNYGSVYKVQISFQQLNRVLQKRKQIASFRLLFERKSAQLVEKIVQNQIQCQMSVCQLLNSVLWADQ
ncbi:Hypothetical_protein [Hexamita inflata]|uniref:Hypothetical_protein n=1 Tax=Hexamita inflata TaxID=28002 RepID=A0AA86U3R6_9EUKA|nr:Hypothetical protein HINF_LOCUS17463 [Hexamita inflata]